MFGLISKKKLQKYIKEIKDENRKEKLYANYEQPISEKQKALNSYSTGYEDGTDNMYNAICHHFKIKSNT